MTGLGWALVLKPVASIAFVAAYYFIVIRGLRWLYPRLPKSRIVDFLFRERGKRTPDYGPSIRVHRQGD